MHVLLVGGGGREHALADALLRSPSLTRLSVTHENPGFDASWTRIPLGSPSQTALAAVEAGVELVVVGPEAPLAAGLADACAALGLACFGPSAGAAQLEASKAFAKQVMEEARVPTAAALVVDASDQAGLALARERCALGRVVIKADGLAAGKGVLVCESAAEALAGLAEVLDGRFGESASRLVLEDLLVGPEVSLLALCDGERAVPLLPAQDHKRLLDGDRGPNTGGMGAYAPCGLVSAAQAEALVQAVHVPVLKRMAARGTPFRGVLYAGLMLTPTGPRVLEFNVRFGDPEAQAILPLWADDLVLWLLGAARGRLPSGTPQFAPGACCSVVLASAGYPGAFQEAVSVPQPALEPGLTCFYAGCTAGPTGLRTSGGRVLALSALGADVVQARARAYAALPGLVFEGAQWRADIAARTS